VDDLTVSAEALMRDATKRLRRALPYRSIYSLPASHLDDAVEQAFRESRAVLEADGAR